MSIVCITHACTCAHTHCVYCARMHGCAFFHCLYYTTMHMCAPIVYYAHMYVYVHLSIVYIIHVCICVDICPLSVLCMHVYSLHVLNMSAYMQVCALHIGLYIDVHTHLYMSGCVFMCVPPLLCFSDNTTNSDRTARHLPPALGPQNCSHLSAVCASATRTAPDRQTSQALCIRWEDLSLGRGRVGLGSQVPKWLGCPLPTKAWQHAGL